ncbi:uncharacterized protein ACA1_036590 [Acanthamoeba castellanii str. Neff]|uniref:Uncharacterized protein n=1 Tax=Acanthamoeba castellanii (strain ATCC 30010 / Neff) TaxID=1257118 RepID=L8HEY3_ACACF|nr:uncharacterized protein ACA1_036590 [Acanthamoeba castellanii str. Neff]ELR22966.1 hypothetical protein ACA1_036590 [Acanthamoeba castellanii str. Neff]
MGKEEKLVVLVAAGQVVPTKGAIFKARWQLANYLQRVNTALSMINLSLNQPLHSLTRDAATPNVMYKAILQHFDSPDVNRDLHDFAELTNIKMSDMETIIGYIN